MVGQKLFLGVDGGGTHCRVRLEDADGQQLGTASAGSANTGLGHETVFSSILKATDFVLQRAGLPAGVYNQLHVGAGLAGLFDETEVRHFSRHPHPFATFNVTSDAITACLGAHAGQNGGICIFGTGSVACYVRDGSYRQFGGWGFGLSDQGSGAWVGLRALQEALKTCDGYGDVTHLSHRIMTYFNESQGDMVRWARSALPANYAAFAPWVVDAAAQQDPLAQSLMHESAGFAGEYLQTLWDQGIEKVSLAGGFASAIIGWLPEETQQRLKPVDLDAMAGALMLAHNPDLLMVT